MGIYTCRQEIEMSFEMFESATLNLLLALDPNDSDAKLCHFNFLVYTLVQRAEEHIYNTCVAYMFALIY